MTWKQGKEEFTATVHIRRLSYFIAVNDVAAMRSEGNAFPDWKVKRRPICARRSQSVRPCWMRKSAML
ncbi:hypothetical protein BTJ40_04235 [Microbulbifer sp. A4B17]|nr:hypothetical protein BTJ40_04235 [Microbulbifer sp. A4B17]